MPRHDSSIFVSSHDKQRIVRRVTQPRPWAAWREIALGRIEDARSELKYIDPALIPPFQQQRFKDAEDRLDAASERVRRRPSIGSAWSGVDVEQAWVNIHAAEVTLIRFSDPVTVKAMIPSIVADASQVLGSRHELFRSLREFDTKNPLNPADRESIAQLVQTVYRATSDEYVRARSFRNILFSTTFVLTLLAVGLGILGALRPGISMWEQNSTPTGLSLWLAELLGLLGASIVGSVAIRRMRGSSQPYAVPMASLLVKLPTGALTAATGLMMMRAGFLDPVIKAASTAGAAQMVAYALILGASQQIVTRLIDQQAQHVLDAVPSIDRDAAQP
jgi:hypothetical protein